MKKLFKIDNEGIIKKFEVKKKRERKIIDIREFQYLGIGFYLITPIFLGVLFGLLTKRIVFFIFLGTIFTFYNLYKITKE